jgi:hypothetical protein
MHRLVTQQKSQWKQQGNSSNGPAARRAAKQRAAAAAAAAAAVQQQQRRATTTTTTKKKNNRSGSSTASVRGRRQPSIPAAVVAATGVSSADRDNFSQRTAGRKARQRRRVGRGQSSTTSTGGSSGGCGGGGTRNSAGHDGRHIEQMTHAEHMMRKHVGAGDLESAMSVLREAVLQHRRETLQESTLTVLLGLVTRLGDAKAVHELYTSMCTLKMPLTPWALLGAASSLSQIYGRDEAAGVKLVDALFGPDAQAHLQQFSASSSSTDNKVKPPEATVAAWSHLTSWLRLLSMELLAEAQQAFQRINRRPLASLVRRGLAMSEMEAKIVDDRGLKVQLTPSASGQPLAGTVTQLSLGSTILLSPQHKRDENAEACHFEGQVSAQMPLCIKLRRPLHEKMAREVGQWRLDKLGNRVGFERAIIALKRLKQTHVPFPGEQQPKHLTDAAMVFLLEAPNEAAAASNVAGLFGGAAVEAEAVARGCNTSQAAAIAHATRRRLTLVQGPPGTGKTHCACEIVLQWVREQRHGAAVLVCADSNTAVDNLAAALQRRGGEVMAHSNLVRFGRMNEVRPELHDITLDIGHPRAPPTAECKRRLKQARVVCATCIGAGSTIMNGLHFPLVLVDEAAQATEAAALVPISRGCKQLVLVGDHHQLPPTVLSRHAELGGMALSLFERAAKAGVRVHMLDTQYRSHPAICQFPAAYFYRGELKDAPTLSSLSRPLPPGFAWPRPQWPVAFLSVEDGQENAVGTSYVNHAEAHVVAEVVAQVLHAPIGSAGWTWAERCPTTGGIVGGTQVNGDPTPPSVGVIAPYKEQVRVLERALAARLHNALAVKCVEVSTVDGFQGREKELIVFSGTRANSAGNVGFVGDWRRVNVSLTRARAGLIVVGHAPTLKQDAVCWRSWVEWAAVAGLLRSVSSQQPLLASVDDVQLGAAAMPPAPPLPPPTLAAQTRREVHRHDDNAQSGLNVEFCTGRDDDIVLDNGSKRKRSRSRARDRTRDRDRHRNHHRRDRRRDN